jgi:hypothetical protein
MGRTALDGARLCFLTQLTVMFLFGRTLADEITGWVREGRLCMAGQEVRNGWARERLGGKEMLSIREWLGTTGRGTSRER